MNQFLKVRRMTDRIRVIDLSLGTEAIFYWIWTSWTLVPPASRTLSEVKSLQEYKSLVTINIFVCYTCKKTLHLISCLQFLSISIAPIYVNFIDILNFKKKMNDMLSNAIHCSSIANFYLHEIVRIQRGTIVSPFQTSLNNKLKTLQ